ncbi:unnamed protein product, partial [Amoebophrya sp. A25]|eukprot:GSA25T00026161001.1
MHSARMPLIQQGAAQPAFDKAHACPFAMLTVREQEPRQDILTYEAHALSGLDLEGMGRIGHIRYGTTTSSTSSFAEFTKWRSLETKIEEEVDEESEEPKAKKRRKDDKSSELLQEADEAQEDVERKPITARTPRWQEASTLQELRNKKILKATGSELPDETKDINTDMLRMLEAQFFDHLRVEREQHLQFGALHRPTQQSQMMHLSNLNECIFTDSHLGASLLYHMGNTVPRKLILPPRDEYDPRRFFCSYSPGCDEKFFSTLAAELTALDEMFKDDVDDLDQDDCLGLGAGGLHLGGDLGTLGSGELEGIIEEEVEEQLL